MSLHNYCLYVLNTDESVLVILLNLEKIKDHNSQIGPIRKDFVRDFETKEYYENGKKLIILKRDFVKKIRKETFKGTIPNFNIEEFRLKNDHFAFTKSSVMHLYYPLSKELDCNFIINDKLKMLEEIGFLEPNSWFIHEKWGVCEFSPDICDRKRAIIKIMCDFPLDFRVSWCRNSLFGKIESHY